MKALFVFLLFSFSVPSFSLSLTCVDKCSKFDKDTIAQSGCHATCAPEIHEFCKKKFDSHPASDNKTSIMANCLKLAVPCHDKCEVTEEDKRSKCGNRCLGLDSL